MVNYTIITVITLILSMGSILCANKPSAPPIGSSYTVQELLTLINSNNPSKSSSFIIPVNGRTIIKDSDCWPAIGPHLDGSISVGAAKLQPLISQNLNTKVTLQADDTLINFLEQTGRLNSQTKVPYRKILLYFTLKGYRFYLNDPYPMRIVARRANAAQNIINKWNIK